MDQTIRKWVEEGKNLFVVAENEEGEVYTQGSSQVVEGVEEHREMSLFLKLRFQMAALEGWRNEYVKVENFTWPRAPCRIRGGGWGGNVVVMYLRELLRILRINKIFSQESRCKVVMLSSWPVYRTRTCPWRLHYII